MADRSKIEWLAGGATWNFAIGCTPTRIGCGQCYAGKFATRHCSNPTQRDYYGSGIAHRGRFTGKVKILQHKLAPPFPWRKKPGLVFVNSMGDTFHDQVPSDVIRRCLEIVRDHPEQHFIMLTKRPRRANEFWEDTPKAPRHLRNLTISVSCSVQEDYDDLWSDLVGCPAYHAISLEPLLGHVHLQRGADWVIVGAETGQKARPCDPLWMARVVDQCCRMSVPVFVKKAPPGAERLEVVREYPRALEAILKPKGAD